MHVAAGERWDKQIFVIGSGHVPEPTATGHGARPWRSKNMSSRDASAFCEREDV